MLNKYNVRALREELELYARNGAWKKFENKATAVAKKDEELWSAVVAHKSRRPRKKGSSLLHTVLKLVPPSPSERVESIVRLCAVSSALFSTDGLHQSPLHVAIRSFHDTSVLRCLLERITEQPRIQKGCNPLEVLDNDHDTPLLKAARLDCSHYLPVLLTGSPLGHFQLLLVRKHHTALWYAAARAAKSAHLYQEYSIPYELQILLVATHFSLEVERGNDINDDDRKAYLDALHNQNDEVSDRTKSLVLRAVMNCAGLLEKYAVPLFDMVLASGGYQNWYRLTDAAGENMLHWLCRQPCSTKVETEVNALLFHRALGTLAHHSHVDVLLLHKSLDGNLPLHFAGDKDYIREMIDAYPSALTSSNDRGELPLHVAIRSETESVVIGHLWQANWVTLLDRHGPTGLCAFALAATTSFAKERSEEELSFLYELLLAAPDALRVQRIGSMILSLAV